MSNEKKHAYILNHVLFVASILMSFAFLHLKAHLSGKTIVVALLFYFLASLLQMVAHECGHLIGGRISGYKLLFLQLGPLTLARNRGKGLSLIRDDELGGQCVMIPERVDKVPYVAYNMGGIYANMLFAGISLVLSRTELFYVSLLFVELMIVGIQKVLLNLIPHKASDYMNDGYIVKLLRHNETVQKDYAMYLKLYGALFWDESFDPQEYMYEREPSENRDEMIYYDEIRDMLSSKQTVSI